METERRLVSTWEMMHKDNEGEAHVTELHKYDYPVEGTNIEELLVRNAEPTIITPSRRRRPTRSETRTLVAGDAQIPFHDEKAFENFQLAVSETQPNNIVILGDMVDLPSFSKFNQRNEWVGTAQSSIDTYHKFLAQTRANAPNANIYVMHGNHEQRFDNYVQRNAAEVLGLRRANLGQEMAVLSLQHLVRYDELEIESIDGYPNGKLWLEDNLKCIHGTHAGKGGVCAAKYLREESESTIYGHTHRQEVAYRTMARCIGSATIVAASPGCLSITDGSVPGFRHTVAASGEVVRHSEDWQQGLLVIDHTPKNHNVSPIRFMEEGFYMDGKFYKNK